MPNVLIVDDSPVDRRIAADCILRLGGTVRHAESGEEALVLLEEEQPTVVLTDLQMGGMSGLNLVEILSHRHPELPVILMTAFGSEETALAAFKAGATSYVPKRHLRRDLGEALRAVMLASKPESEGGALLDVLQETETRFVIGYEPAEAEVLIGHLAKGLEQLSRFDESEIMQVRTALTEAVRNAIDHGNLELDSDLREGDDEQYQRLGSERSKVEPFRDRRVFVTARWSPSTATYVIRDEGPGFDPSTLPDPRDPENLLRPSGRGIMLMRMFMDDVAFNETGNEVTMVLHREVP